MEGKRKGFTIWLTGLSGSGKSTIAKLLAEKLQHRRVELLDGDEIRQNISKGLGYSKEDRDTNIRRIGYVAHVLSRNGIIVIVSAISPYKAIREENRRLIKDFIEVYVNCPIEICEKRDVKGLYKKARAGEIPQFTGISDPYEPPDSPEVICYTAEESPEVCAEKIINKAKELGYL